MNSDDDIYNEDVEDLVIGNQSWNRVRDVSYKAGFRDGISDGREVKLQEGFNTGYNHSYESIHPIAFLRGVISALQCQCQEKDKLAELHQKVNHLEQKVVHQYKVWFDPAVRKDTTETVTAQDLGGTGNENVTHIIEKAKLLEEFNSCKSACCDFTEKYELADLKKAVEELVLALQE